MNPPPFPLPQFFFIFMRFWGKFVKKNNFAPSPLSASTQHWHSFRVHLYYSESERESDVASNLLHCFQSVYLYYSGSSGDKHQRKNRFRSNINEPLNFDGHGDGNFDVNCVQTLSHDTSI